MEIEDRYARLSQVQLHYVAAGVGRPVVLLHGFPDYWRGWDKQIGPLAAAGHRVIIPDLRGYNLSDKPSGVSAYRLELLAGDVADLIETVGDGLATVVGHDWGGVIAWHVAEWYPALVDRLVIMNGPHTSSFRKVARRPRQILKSSYVGFFQLPWIPETMLSAGDYAVLRSTLRRASPTFTAADLELYVEAAKRSDALRYPLNYYRAAVRRNPVGAMRPHLIETPTLVMWGDKDAVLDPILAEPDRRWVPDVRVEHFDDAGHWVHRDRAEDVNAALIDFLGSR